MFAALVCVVPAARPDTSIDAFKLASAANITLSEHGIPSDMFNGGEDRMCSAALSEVNNVSPSIARRVSRSFLEQWAFSEKHICLQHRADANCKL